LKKRKEKYSFLSLKIFDEKLNWDAQAKVHCWSEIDLRQLTKKKSIFAVNKFLSSKK
jgi:hypothetical protein